MSKRIDRDGLKSLADGMLKLATRLESARPAEDASAHADELCRQANRMWTSLVFPIVPLTDEDRAQGFKEVRQERRGTDDPTEIPVENVLKRAARILDELSQGRFENDAAKELR